MATLSQAGFHAGRGNRFVYHNGMTGCINGFSNGFAAVGAGADSNTGLGAGGQSSYFAGVIAVAGGLSLIVNIAVLADRAGVGGIALCCAGGGSNHRAVAMTIFGNDGLGGQNLAADGAMAAFRQARCGAGCGNSLVGDLSVAEGRSLVSGVGVAAQRATIGGKSSFSAARSGYLRHIVMSALS